MYISYKCVLSDPLTILAYPIERIHERVDSVHEIVRVVDVMRVANGLVKAFRGYSPGIICGSDSAGPCS